jgi:spore maturation protein CgeB
MRIAFYGSSLLSSYWNGAATYYRGMLKALASHGHAITFYEPDAFGRQQHRDMEPPPWARVVVWENNQDACRRVIAEAASADVVVKANGVGVFDASCWKVMAASPPRRDATVLGRGRAPHAGEMRAEPSHPCARRSADLDMVLTYGGGPAGGGAYEGFGAQRCVPVYNALDRDALPRRARSRLRLRPRLPRQPAAGPRGTG